MAIFCTIKAVALPFICRRGGAAVECTDILGSAADFSDWTLNNLTISGEAPTGSIPEFTFEGADIRHSVNLNASTQYIFSGIFSPDASNWIRLEFLNKDLSPGAAFFDVFNGVIGTQSGSALVSASIESVGGGEYLCSITINSGTGASQPRVEIQCAADDDEYFALDGNSIFIWHYQRDAKVCVV